MKIRNRTGLQYLLDQLYRYSILFAMSHWLALTLWPLLSGTLSGSCSWLGGDEAAPCVFCSGFMPFETSLLCTSHPFTPTGEAGSLPRGGSWFFSKCMSACGVPRVEDCVAFLCHTLHCVINYYYFLMNSLLHVDTILPCQ